MEIFIHLFLCIKYLTKMYYKQCRIRRVKSGADGVRTHDLRIANATLSQLSYGPMVS